MPLNHIFIHVLVDLGIHKKKKCLLSSYILLSNLPRYSVKVTVRHSSKLGMEDWCKVLLGRLFPPT